MKKNIWLSLAAVAVSLGLTTAVQAVPIVGSIGFSGSYTQVGGTLGNLSTATAMSINPLFVGIVPGSSSGIWGAAPTIVSFMTSVGVNGFLGVNTPPTLLWSIMNGGVTYNFNLSTEVQSHTSVSELDLEGSAVVTDSAGDPASVGSWTLQFGNKGTAFTFNNSSSAVPDGGTTAMLLGGALAGLGLLRRKLMA